MDWATATTTIVGMICTTTLILSFVGVKSNNEGIEERIEDLEEKVFNKEGA